MFFDIEPIIYRRKEIDRGVILGRTEYKSQLVRTQNPLQCEDLTDDTRIECLSPHKRNIVVYVPIFYLSEDQEIRTLIGKNGQCVYETHKILEITPYHVETELLHSEETYFQRRAAKRVDIPADTGNFEEENPFLTGSECSTEEPADIPAVITVGKQVFRKKTNFVFLYSENQKRTGSKWEKIPREDIVSIYGDVVLVNFPSGPSEVDVLTGRRILRSRRWIDERKHHIQAGGKISPSFRPA
jgi:hypothetical protein